MNANELADNWETKLKPHERHNTREETMYWVNQYRLFGDTAATKLRQLQAENEALKAENKFFKDLMGDVEILRKVQEKW